MVKGSRADYRYRKPSTAELVIEVAITSVGVDRMKAPIYAEAGISEYWIVQPEAKLTEVYRDPKDGHYTSMIEFPASTTVKSMVLPGFTFDLKAALGTD